MTAALDISTCSNAQGFLQRFQKAWGDCRRKFLLGWVLENATSPNMRLKLASLPQTTIITIIIVMLEALFYTSCTQNLPLLIPSHSSRIPWTWVAQSCPCFCSHVVLCCLHRPNTFMWQQKVRSLGQSAQRVLLPPSYWLTPFMPASLSAGGIYSSPGFRGLRWL